MEPRNPASTALDLMLAEALLGSVPPPGPATADAPVERAAGDVAFAFESPVRATKFFEPVAPTSASAESQSHRSDEPRPEWTDEPAAVVQPVFRPLAVTAPAVSSGDGQYAPVFVSAGRGSTADSRPPAIATPPDEPLPATNSLGGTDEGGEGEPAPPPAPFITVTLSTQFVPVNANDHNGSPWKKVDGVTQEGLPERRDFNVAPIPNGGAGDPELKAVTVTVQNARTNNALHVAIQSANGQPGGKATPYIDNKKTRTLGQLDGLIGGGGVSQRGGPTGQYQYSENNIPAVFTFYLEGVEPSRMLQDVKLKVDYWGYDGPTQAVVSNIAVELFTVTPVVREFKVTAQDPKPQFYRSRDAAGQWVITGMTTGSQGDPPVGTAPGSVRSGFKFDADLTYTTNLNGRPFFLQYVTNVRPWQSGHANGVIHNYKFTDGKPDFPRLDAVPELQQPPFYPTYPEISGPPRWKVHAIDTPFLYWARDGALTSMHVMFSATTHLVWRYDDKTIYSLGRSTWHSILGAVTRHGQLVLDDMAENKVLQAISQAVRGR